MDLLDSDLFVLDLRFQNDPRYPANKTFLEMRGVRRATTIYNLLEVCGVLSFNLTHEALLILYGLGSRTARQPFHIFLKGSPHLGLPANPAPTPPRQDTPIAPRSAPIPTSLLSKKKSGDQ